jgi:hypothetical protein
VRHALPQRSALKLGKVFIFLTNGLLTIIDSEIKKIINSHGANWDVPAKKVETFVLKAQKRLANQKKFLRENYHERYS